MEQRLPTSARIAEGRTADVFAWGNNAVLKLYRDGYPADEATREAARARRAVAAGLPTPAVIDVLMLHNRQGIIYERVDGPTMLEALLARPDSYPVLAQCLAEVHTAIHSCTVSDLPSQRERLQQKIHSAAGLPCPAQTGLLAALEHLPHATLLCHGDLHPCNILLTECGPVIIDWVDATHGYPLADVARTWILLQHSHAPAGLSQAQQQRLKRLRRLFCEAYLQRYFEIRPAGRNELQAWFPPVAAARLSERLSDAGETHALMALASATNSSAGG